MHFNIQLNKVSTENLKEVDCRIYFYDNIAHNMLEKLIFRLPFIHSDAFSNILHVIFISVHFHFYIDYTLIFLWYFNLI